MTHFRDLLGLSPMSDDPDRDRWFEEIRAAIPSLLTIEGVEGIGEPVTVISPGDLPRCGAGRGLRASGRSA
jgi:hypothetical protein